jgi:hypothetical protein
MLHLVLLQMAYKVPLNVARQQLGLLHYLLHLHGTRGQSEHALSSAANSTRRSRPLVTHVVFPKRAVSGIVQLLYHLRRLRLAYGDESAAAGQQRLHGAQRADYANLHAGTCEKSLMVCPVLQSRSLFAVGRRRGVLHFQLGSLPGVVASWGHCSPADASQGSYVVVVCSEL